MKKMGHAPKNASAARPTQHFDHPPKDPWKTEEHVCVPHPIRVAWKKLFVNRGFHCVCPVWEEGARKQSRTSAANLALRTNEPPQ